MAIKIIKRIGEVWNFKDVRPHDQGLKEKWTKTETNNTKTMRDIEYQDCQRYIIEHTKYRQYTMTQV
jgi:hypothetical protein